MRLHGGFAQNMGVCMKKLSSLMVSSLALILSLGSTPAFAQASADVMQYDALGRLTSVQAGRGALTKYNYDPANNRSSVNVQRQLDSSWAATSLNHAIGFAESFGGWAAYVTAGPGHITYGPYTTAIPTGNRVAVWRMMTDVISVQQTDIVARIDVYDSTAGQVLAIKDIVRSSFVSPMAYQVFELPFTLSAGSAGHSLEMRTWFTAKAYMNIERIGYY
jgi:YD repeat-containing protein